MEIGIATQSKYRIKRSFLVTKVFPSRFIKRFMQGSTELVIDQ